MIKRITPADMISLVNTGFGFLASLVLLSSGFLNGDIRIQISFCFILLAMLADGLDGVVARKTRHGELGEYLEAMADMTSLCIAPALFVAMVNTETYGSVLGWYLMLSVVLILFVVCSIIRLSSFHIMKQKEFFVGLPASASTIFIVGLSFVGVPLPYVLLVLILVSLAMISPICFIKPGLKVNAIATMLILCAIAARHSFYDVAPWLLIGALFVYALVGPVWLYSKKRVTKTS